LTAFDIGLVGLFLVALVLAALSASAETALTSISRIQLRKLVDEGHMGALTIQRLHQDPNTYLTAILTLNTTAIVFSSTAAALIAAHHGLGDFWQETLVGLLDTLVVLVLAEITAKSWALANMRYALAVAPILLGTTVVLRYPIAAMSAVARLMTRGRGHARGPFVTEEELKMLVTVGEEEGIIEEEEREMIHGVIEIGDMAVREVMIPRIDIVAVEVSRPVAEIVQLVLKHGHTRIPVYEETIDHIVGVAYAKDLLRYSASRAERRSGDLRKVMRKPYFVPENKNLSEFLHEMRENRVHMAIVIDEHGQTAGVITIEDIIEEIVGPIRDEYDVMEEEEIQFLAQGEAVLDARVALADAREELGLALAAEDVDSLGGFIYSHLGTIPRSGQVVDVEGTKMTVVSVRGQRIGKVRVRSESPFPGAVRREEARAEEEGRSQSEAASEAAANSGTGRRGRASH